VVKASGRCRMVQGHVGWGKSGLHGGSGLEGPGV